MVTYFAVVCFNNHPTDSEAHAYTLFFGGAKRFEHQVGLLPIDTGAGVRNGDEDEVLFSLCSDCNARWKGIASDTGFVGVVEEIDEYLLKLDAIAADFQGLYRHVHLGTDASEYRRGLHQPDGVTDKFRKINDRIGGRLFLYQMANALNDCLYSPAIFKNIDENQAKLGNIRRLSREKLQSSLGIGPLRRERLIDLVDDFAAQRLDRGDPR